MTKATVWLFAGALFPAVAQDTVLVRVHTLSYPVNYVAVDALGDVWISGAQGVSIWNGTAFDVQDPFDFSGRIRLEDDLVDLEAYIAETGRAPYERHLEWDKHVPGSRYTLTSGKDTTGLFWVCDGLSLFNFRVVCRPEQMLPGKSIRGMVWLGDSLIAQTYDGIFMNGELRCPVLAFGDGNFVVHEDSLFAFGMELAVFPLFGESCRVLDLYRTRHETFQAGIRWREQLWVGNNVGFGRWNGNDITYVWKGGDVRYLEASSEGVYLMTSDDGVLLWDGYEVRRTGIPPGVACSGMQQDRDGSWWLATERGLGLWKPDEKSLTFLTTANGLASNAVCEVGIDRWGKVWCSTYNGLNRYDPVSSAWELHFSGVEFNRGSFAEREDGSMWFGSVDGVYSLIPEAPNSKQVNGEEDSRLLWLLFGLFITGSSLTGVLLVRWKRQMAAKQNAWLAEKFAMERSLFLAEVARHVLEGLPHSSVASVAKAMGMSERHLYRKAKSLGFSAGELIRNHKLAQAEGMLESGRPILEVAQHVGYTPEYLKKLRNATVLGELPETKKGDLQPPFSEEN
jgi:AraC-like DNA-binding protein